MRIIGLIICSILVHYPSFAQNNFTDKYFPREQIVISDCIGEEDENLCLYDLIGSSISTLINEKLQKLRINEDTLKTSVGFSLSKKGRLDNFPIRVFISNDLLSKELFESIERLIKKLPRFEVSNRKSEHFRSLHIFEHQYIINRSNFPFTTKQIQTDKKYEGGTILELPVYPGCENLSYEDTLKCFRAKIKRHIIEHFSYPTEALKNNIQGIVTISFLISEDGKISNIKTEGGALILQTEALRIIDLLPTIQPAKENGKPVKIPYSVPITFKLS